MNSRTEFRHNIPKDLQELLLSHTAVREKWEKLTPLARNEWICWVTIVKKAETRKEHLARLAEDLQCGKKTTMLLARVSASTNECTEVV